MLLKTPCLPRTYNVVLGGSDALFMQHMQCRAMAAAAVDEMHDSKHSTVF